MYIHAKPGGLSDFDTTVPYLVCHTMHIMATPCLWANFAAPQSVMGFPFCDFHHCQNKTEFSCM